MKVVWACAIFVLLLPAAAWTGQQQAPPTLGPEQASPNAPPTATTVNPRRLMQIKAIYIERMDNGLGMKLMEALARLSWAQIVDDPSKADAIVRGTCFDSRRLKELHSEVFINDRASDASIWQDVVRVRLYPPPLEKAVSETAGKVAKDLRYSLDHVAE